MKLDEMKCGGCACSTFRVFLSETGEVVLRCCGCSSGTVIGPPKPKLDFGWEREGQRGIVASGRSL